jgi:hypothetical protein
MEYTVKQEALMKTALITTIMVVFIAPAYTHTINIKVEKSNNPVSDVHRTFMQLGPLQHEEVPEDMYGLECRARAFRVSFLLYEFFVDIAIEELEFRSFECKEINIINTYYLLGSEIGPKMCMEGLSQPSFEGWKSWDSFVISEKGTQLLFKIKKYGEFEISKKSNE